jgi:Ca2+ transporting ATPase
MTKHILGQSVYQLIVICFALFMGTKFLPSGYANKNLTGTSDISRHYAANDNGKLAINTPLTFLDGLIRSGLEIDGYDSLENSPSVHFTYNFNIFVMMTIFNFINARKLEDELFIFSNITKAPFFGPIVIIIVVLQFIIVTFGGIAFRCAPWVSLPLNSPLSNPNRDCSSFHG